MPKQEAVAVTGIWLRRSRTGTIEVLIERDDRWWLVISEYGNTISHIVEPSGMLKGKPDRLE